MANVLLWRRLLTAAVAASLLAPAPLAAQVAGGNTPGRFYGSGTSGGPDALLSVLGGGAIPLQGQLQATSPLTQFLGPDGSEQAAVASQSNAVDSVRLQGNIAGGLGGAVYAYSATDPNVDLNLAAQGNGGVYLYNGTGMLLNATAPGGVPVANYPTVQAASTGKAVVYGVSGGDSRLNVKVTGDPTCGAVAIGSAPTATGCNAAAIGGIASATGDHAIALGDASQADMFSSVSIGYYAYNHNRVGGVCFANGSRISRGANQNCIFILRGTLAGSGTVRLTTDGSSNPAYDSMSLHSMPGTVVFMDCRLTVNRADTTEGAIWTIVNVGIRNVGGTVSFVAGSPTSFTAGPADSGITNVSPSLALDQSGLQPNISLTGTGSNTYYGTAVCNLIDNS